MKINILEPMFMFLISLICIFMEMISPANFLFLSIALAFFTSGIYLYFATSIWMFFFLWTFVFFISLFGFTNLMKKKGFSIIDKSSADGSVLAIPGQQCKIIRELPNGDLFVFLGKEEWIATPLKNESFLQGDIGLVVKIVGNRLIIKKL